MDISNWLAKKEQTSHRRVLGPFHYELLRSNFRISDAFLTLNPMTLNLNEGASGSPDRGCGPQALKDSTSMLGF